MRVGQVVLEVLGEGDWRFVSSSGTGGKAHLQGYVREKAPATKNLLHIETAALDYYDKYWKVFWHMAL